MADEGTVRNVHYGDILTVLGSIVDPVVDNLPFIADEAKAKKYQSHILRDGDVIFADTAEDDAVGKAVEMKNCGSPVVSGLHTTPCRPITGLFEHGYLGYYLNAPAYHNQLRPLMQVIKVTSVSRTAMNETEVNHPTSPEEQQKIAALFTEVDNLISATSDEVSALEEAKKGMMQKIFSQEVRFRRDDGTEYPDWEEKAVGKICSVSTGKSNTQDKIDEGQYPFYVRSPIIEHSDKYLFDEEAVITVGDGVGTGKVYHYVNTTLNFINPLKQRGMINDQQAQDIQKMGTNYE